MATLLYACDDLLLARLFGEILTQRRYSVESGSYAQALAAVHRRLFDLVLVHTSDDTERGIEFCHELKELRPTQPVALIKPSYRHVERNGCPDHVIHNDYGPESILREIAEIIRN